MLRLSISALTCLLVLACAWADDKEDAAKKEQDKFQGEWTIVGQDDAVLTIKGAEYTFAFGDNKEKGKFKFNPSVTPAQIDVDITEGTDAGKKQVGIYVLKDDTLKMCFAKAGETTRPEKFEAKEDGSIILFAFVKVKK